LNVILNKVKDLAQIDPVADLISSRWRCYAKACLASGSVSICHESQHHGKISHYRSEWQL